MGLEQAYASLVGLAVGDAFGAQILRPGDHPEVLGRQLPAAPWSWTDDTEMACSVFAVLQQHGQVDQDALAEEFATRLDSARGYGPGAEWRLNQIRNGRPWQEISEKDGHGSWGNGGAMRVAPLGAWFCDDLPQALRQAELSAVVTHSHLEGIAGTVAVAAAAALRAASPGLAGADLLDGVIPLVPPGRVRDGIAWSLKFSDARDVAAKLGTGREMAAHDTVPLALWIAARFADSFTDALWTVARFAEDVDTVGAIVGGVLAADGSEVPDEWRAACEPLPAWVAGPA
ncbi:ADP-ribosylglycohydrolase family protein [Amycolatopsis sp., V23-08]|uniref:ADP-ribosylglycohydrolase family protein n=1 Tax=Amycolatopsis heterodermiae TaxID=3110235 RepID=A0ABU5R779_9PSEU|nr:ADP-ribosylglycohydrolase family protein [Amycolatopsis sp., V23-08]MEA5362013.1 ADP-ribosylglycohydrolase family protein [Amycolatopsis sp., V23-08]